jgi:adenylate cyclase
MSKRERTRLLASLVIALVVGLGLTAAYRAGWLATQQQSSHDGFYRKEAYSNELGNNAAERFVIVAMDSKSMQALGRWSGWDRSYYAHVIDSVKAGGARVLALDVGFFEPAPGDAELARAIREARIVIQPVTGNRFYQDVDGYVRLMQIERPIEELQPGTAAYGNVSVIPDQDGTVRSMPLVARADDDLVPTLGLAAVAEYLLVKPELSQQPPTFKFAGRQVPVGDLHQMRINFAGPPSVQGRGETFRVVSFVDVLENRVDPKVFNDKLVFLGWLGVPGSADDYWTPVSSPEVGKMAGVEVHANTAATIVRDVYLTPQDAASVVMVVMLFALVAGLLAARLGILKALAGVAAIMVGYVTLVSVAFDKGLILNMWYPNLALLLSYAGSAVYQVMFEQRHSRFLRGAMGRYLSPSVMEEIVRRPELLRLGGEKREMTVLFSDIRGFTSFSEQLDPQELVTLLNEYLTAMTNVIYKHDGVLDKYMGDAIMAFWNGPVSQPDHAKRGCLAALDMLEVLHSLHDRWKDRGIPSLNMGVGLNTGPMSVGNMGSDTRFDYTVMGDAVNLGSRLEGTNKEYGTNIVISQTTLDDVKDEGFVVRFLDLVAVKGKAQPVAVYELIGRAGEFGSFTPELLATYERGIHLYRDQDFAAAAEAFREVLAVRPHDGPSAMYLERCDELMAAPPPPDWDGVYVMTHK